MLLKYIAFQKSAYWAMIQHDSYLKVLHLSKTLLINLKLKQNFPLINVMCSKKLFRQIHHAHNIHFENALFYINQKLKTFSC